MRHVWERGKVHPVFWWGNLIEGDHLEDLGVDERIILKCMVNEYDGRTWT
jgi:hypothetical protein